LPDISATEFMRFHEIFEFINHFQNEKDFYGSPKIASGKSGAEMLKISLNPSLIKRDFTWKRGPAVRTRIPPVNLLPLLGGGLKVGMMITPSQPPPWEWGRDFWYIFGQHCPVEGCIC
jgi:hypothetical protein